MVDDLKFGSRTLNLYESSSECQNSSSESPGQHVGHRSSPYDGLQALSSTSTATHRTSRTSRRSSPSVTSTPSVSCVRKKASTDSFEICDSQVLTHRKSKKFNPSVNFSLGEQEHLGVRLTTTIPSFFCVASRHLVCFSVFSHQSSSGQRHLGVCLTLSTTNSFTLTVFSLFCQLTSNLSPFLASRLLKCGDIHPNPGPTTVGTSVDLKVVSYNIRGLGDEKKCRHLINYFNKNMLDKNTDSIIALQETLIQTPLKIPYIWRGNLHFTPGTGNGRGCITLLSSHLNIVSHRTLDDRAHVLAISRSGEQKVSYIVANIYAPHGYNDAKIRFYEEVLDAITELEERFECDNVVLLGDFNIIFKEAEKSNRSFTGTEKRIASVIGQLLDDANLRDAWGDQTAFTWRRANSNVFSLLDRVMYRPNHQDCVSIKSNWSISGSDHAAVISVFKIKNRSCSTKRANIARLDPSLLTSRLHSEEIRTSFLEMFATSCDSWNPHTKLEFAKVCLRSVVERVQANRNKTERSEEEGVDESLNKLIDRLASIGASDAEEREELIVIIEALRDRKGAMIDEKGKRLAERLGTKWFNEGEKSNKYFLRLLNRQAPDKLANLVSDDGSELKDIDEINKAVVEFYKELYENFDDSLIERASNDATFFNNLDQCSNNEDLLVSAPVTVEELTKVLQTCQDSAPGPDGIMYSYLRFFWDIFGPLLVSAWNFSLQTGSLTPSHQLSFLRLIPKAGKDPKRLTNWRPITLSNCDHKLITKLYSLRLTNVAGKLIKERQTAYIKGRLINDNLRTLIAAIEVANEESNIDGLVVSLDAKKAFDSVDHQYIRDCLSRFGFNSFIPIFNILYKDLRSDIVVNSGIHKGYRINRGVKQGDALSCILFIMCMEPLIRNIESNPNIEPVRSRSLDSDLPKALAYADDVSNIIANNATSLQGIFSEYERLTKKSGLQLNADKTDFLSIRSPNLQHLNARQLSFNYLNQRFACVPKPEIKINGIWLQMNRDRMRTGNVDRVLVKIEAHLRSWSRRGLSTLGKILVLKTFGISQIIYLMQSMCLKPADFKRLNSLLYKYIWNRNFGAPKAPERIKREIINLPIKLGGFGMLDIIALDRSLKLKMLARILFSQHPFLELIRSKINMSDFFFPTSNQMMDKPINQAICSLAEDRQKLFSLEGIESDTKLVKLVKEIRLKNLVNARGKTSLIYFNLRLQGKTKVRDLDRDDLRRLTSFIQNRDALNLINITLGLNVGIPDPADHYLYWYKGLKPMTKLTAKEYREAQSVAMPICTYKIGAVLSPSENDSWTLKLKKLTSTRHKNMLLKVAHGDWYSKERLHRFGLIPDPLCEDCHQVESIRHKLLECPRKIVYWEYLAGLEGFDLHNMADPIEFTLGMHKHDSMTDFTLHAELVTRLMLATPELNPERTIGLLKAKLNRVDYKNKGKYR